MKDFNFFAPTRVVFGRESEEKLPQGCWIRFSRCLARLASAMWNWVG